MRFNTKKGGTLTEKITTAISSLQRDVYAMATLRCKLEGKLKTEPKPPLTSHDLQRMLELVRAGEESLHEIALSVESARFLQEFIVIVTNAAVSVSEVKDELEKAVPAAEKALEEIQNAIMNGSSALIGPDREKHEIVAEAADAIACQRSATKLKVSQKSAEEGSRQLMA